MKLSGNAYSYVRFSSARQSEGDSLRRQAALAKKFAEKHGLSLDSSTYQDLGVSAFKGKNAIEGKLGTFLKAVDEGAIPRGSILLVESLDRISRAQVDEALMLFLSIMQRGITVVTLFDEQIYSTAKFKQDSGMSLMVSIMLMSRAHEESATKSRRIREKWQAKVAAWTPGTIMSHSGPGWLRLDDKKTNWEIIPEKAAVVQQIFKMAAEGHGAIKTVTYLEENKIPTLRNAQFWTHGVISALRSNPAVMGTLVQKDGNVIEDYYPAVVPKETWLLVQDGVRTRTKTGGVKSEKISNLFSGISFCLYCGNRTRFVPTYKGSAYVQCLRSYSNNPDCQAPPFPYGAAEDAILDRMMNVQSRLLDNPFESNEVDKRLVLTEEIEQLKKRQAKAIELMMELPDVGPLKAELAKLQDRIGVLSIEIGKMPQAPLTVAESSNAKAMYRAHKELVKDGDSPELAEKRLQMQTAIRRTLRKVEFGPCFRESKLNDADRVFFENKSRKPILDTPDFLVQMTYQSGTVRIADAGPFMSERGIKQRARRKAKKTQH